MFDTYDLLQTPALLIGDKDHDLESIEKMIQRSLATRDFLEGKLSPSDFEEALFENGYDPFLCVDAWEEGGILL